MSITLRAKRILTGALAGALVLGLLPAGVASAATTACEGAASNQFADSNPTHQANIDCIAAYNVVSGFANGTFGGSQNITRGQMATFIARFAATTLNVDITDIEVASHTFTDVAGNVHADNIARIFGLNVTAGRTATTFAPNDTITRAEAATMLANAHVALQVDLTGVTPSTAFTDLGTSVHADNINILAGAGVVSGKTATTFAPSASILRAEAATLLVRSITVLRSQNLWDAPALVAPTTNQTFTVTPGTETVVDVGGTAAERSVTYTVSNPVAATTHTIRLFAAANVAVDANGVVTFPVNTGTGTSKVATQGAVPNAEISVVNGVSGPGDTTATAQPANGQITFTVTSAGADSVVPVVYFEDTTTTTGLNLDADNEPIAAEPFGIGGTYTALLAEASFGSWTSGNKNIAGVNTDANRFNDGTNTYFYSSTDTFQLDGTAITFAQFEGLLANGQTMAGNYNPNGASVFNITDANVTDVTTISAVATGNSVAVTYTRPSGNGSGTTYTLQRKVDGAAVSTFANVSGATEAAGTGTGVFVFTDASVPNGDYNYRVQTTPVIGAVVDGTATGAITVPSAADTQGPRSLTTRLVTNAGFESDIDAGDVIRFTFDEAAVVTSSASIRFTDTNNDPYQFTNGVNATMTVNAAEVTLTGSDAGTYAAGRVLTVTVTGNPTPILGTVAADLPARYNLTVTAAAGIADAAGNVWDVAGSGQAAVQEVQTVTINNATGGSFTLTFDGETTGALDYNISTADLKAALEDLANITDVTVAGTPSTGTLGGPPGEYTVTFVDPAGNVVEMTADGSFTGTSPTVTVATTTQGSSAVNGTVVSN